MISPFEPIHSGSNASGENPVEQSITHAVVESKGLDLRLTETHFLSLDEVTNASVWFDSGRIHAHVSVMNGAKWTEASLKQSCCHAVGLTHTPHSILILVENFISTKLPLAS